MLLLDVENTIKAIRAYEANDHEAFIETGVFDTRDGLTVFMLEEIAMRSPDDRFWLKVKNYHTQWQQQAVFMYFLTVKSDSEAISALAHLETDGPISDVVSTAKMMVLVLGQPREKFRKTLFGSTLKAFTSLDPTFLMNIKKVA